MAWPGLGRVPARPALREPAWAIGVWGRVVSIRPGWAAGWRSDWTGSLRMTATTTGASPGRIPPGVWGVARSAAMTRLLVPTSGAPSSQPIPGAMPPVRRAWPGVAAMNRRCGLPPPQPFQRAAARKPFPHALAAPPLRHAAVLRPSPGARLLRLLLVFRRLRWPPAPPLPELSSPHPRPCPPEPPPGTLGLPPPIRRPGPMMPASPCRAGNVPSAPPNPQGRPVSQRSHRPDPWVVPCPAPPVAARRCSSGLPAVTPGLRDAAVMARHLPACL